MRINYFLILNFYCYQTRFMLSRHFTTFQVKCNFCLEWMSLATQLKFSIHVCDSCLHKGCGQKSLKTLSSSGVVYELHMLDRQLGPLVQRCQKSIQTIQEDVNPMEKQTFNLPQQTQLTTLRDNCHQAVEWQIEDIKTKWSIIQSFINQKDFLSTVEIGYLKILLSQNPQQLNSLSSQQPPIDPYPNSIPNQTSQFSDHQNFLKISSLKQNNIYESVSNFDDVQINIKLANKKKSQIPSNKSQKLKQNKSKGKQNTNLKSPCKITLKERDLNRNYLSNCKLPQLKQNSLTSTKRFTTQFLDELPSSISSRISSPAVLGQRSSRSAFGSSCVNSMTKRLNYEQIKRFEQTKGQIVKYLDKNYDSHSLARLMLTIVFEAYKKTTVIGKSIELISYNLSYTDFSCYLESLDWTDIEVLKLVNTRLRDDQLKTLVDFIITNRLEIKVLVLTGNRLSETSIQVLTDQDLPSVREIYLGKNHITKGKVRAQTFALQNKYSLYM